MIRRLGLAIILVTVTLAPSFTGASIRYQTPTSLEIVERLIKAVGGRDARLKIKSQKATGTIEFVGSDSKGTFEIYLKAPNLGLTIIKLTNGIEFRSGYDGKRSWSQILPDKAEDDPPAMQAANKREADFYKYLHFKDHYPTSKVTGIEDVEGSKAYVVEATPTDKNFPEKLYFDVRTGLLILRVQSHENGEGKKPPDLTYYDDYREVDGVKWSFSSRIVQSDSTMLTKTTEIKNNLVIDDAIFSRPGQSSKP